MMRLLTIVMLMSLSSVIDATEIEGRIIDEAGNGVSGAKVTIICGAYVRSEMVGSEGRYRIADVPDGQACTLQISFGGLESSPYAFRSEPGKLTFDRQMRQYGDKLVVF